jgi:hypothetical protein
VEQGRFRIDSMDDLTRSACEKAGAGFLRLVQRVAHDFGGKQGLELAASAGVDPGQFSRALNHQGLHLCVRCHLPHVMNRDRQRLIVRGFAEFHGGTWTPKPALSPEEENRMLREEVEQMRARLDQLLARLDAGGGP